MKKISIIFCSIFFSFSLFSLDPGNVSATLYSEISEESSNSGKVITLFENLIITLSQQSEESSHLKLACSAYEKYLSGDDVREETKELWHLCIGQGNDKIKIDNTYRNSFPLQFSSLDVLKNNPLIDSKHYRTIKPWIIPKTHPMHSKLNAIFSASRATQDKTTFEEAGFVTFAVQPRSFIRVARHSELPGYVVKVYLDTERKLKHGTPGWKWFSRRCEGAKRICRYY